MSPDTLVLTDQGHVNKLIFILQFAHTLDYVGLVVGPLDTELCAGHDGVDGGVDGEEEGGGGIVQSCFYITKPDLSWFPKIKQ